VTDVDCWLPLRAAVMDAVPAAAAVMLKVAVNAPDDTVTVAGTVATAGALLVSATLAPPAGADAVNVTVPWIVPPAATLVALTVTLAKPSPLGAFGDPEPQL
jgi:hypothetical protein